MIILQNEEHDDNDNYAYFSKIIRDYLHILLQQIDDENEYDYLCVHVVF